MRLVPRNLDDNGNSVDAGIKSSTLHTQLTKTGHFTSVRRLFALPRGGILSVMAMFRPLRIESTVNGVAVSHPDVGFSASSVTSRGSSLQDFVESVYCLSIRNAVSVLC
jgi:hypothetical protein